MATLAAPPAPPQDVAVSLAACPAAAQAHLTAMRGLIYATAAERAEIGALTETLKWGQPAYLTEQSKSGTTLRLGWAADGSSVSLLVHCQTSLISEWRARYDDMLTFVGHRELCIPTDTDLPRAPLTHCVAMALTYHARKAS